MTNPIKVKLIDSNLKKFLKKFNKLTLELSFDLENKKAIIDDGFQSYPSEVIAKIDKSTNKYLILNTISKDTGRVDNFFKFELLEAIKELPKI